MGIADTVFPPICVACGDVLNNDMESFFCSGCFSKIGFSKSPICSCCGLPFINYKGENHLCSDCISREQYFSAARSVGRYETPLRDAIHLFKYKGKIAVGKALGRLMAGFEYDSFNMRDYSLIMPVPLHQKRLRERGFNQSVVLASEVAVRHHINLDFMTLKRMVYTEPQVNLGRKERDSNVNGAFSITSSEGVNGERIILIDDVYTTGSTVRECARVLLENGAADVAVLTLARAVF